MASNRPTRSKYPALITYVIALAFLIAGLILPLGAPPFVIDMGKMPVLQLGGALKLFDLPAEWGVALSPGYSFPVTVFGYSFDFGAALLLAYAFAVVLGIILLIPAIFSKRKSAAARILILIAELFALTVLLPMSIISLENVQGVYNLSVLVPCAVTLIAVIIQSFVYLGKSGVMKSVIFLLSAVAALFALGNIAAAVPALLAPIQSLADMMKGNPPFRTGTGLFSLNGTEYGNANVLVTLFAGWGNPAADGNAAVVATHYLFYALSALVLLNLLLDLYGLGKRTNKFMLVCNIVRYSLEFAVIAALAATVAAAGGSFGVMLYLLLFVAIVQLVLQIARFAHLKKAEQRTADLTEDEEDEDAEIPDSDDEYAFEPNEHAPLPVMPETAVASVSAVAEPEPEQAAATVYNGPSDNFIRKLSDDEKMEFTRIFLERSEPNLSVIPNYIVGGDNSKFFSMIFIYFARVRDIVTDGLMNKFYREVNLMD